MEMDITAGGPLVIRGTVETVHGAEYVGKNGTELRKVDLRAAGDRRVLQFEFFGRNIPQDMEDYQSGDAVAVTFDINQREWQGRTFTRLSGLRIERADGEKESGGAEAQGVDDGGIPF